MTHRSSILAMAILIGAAGAAQAAGDPAAGEKIVNRICRQCHLIGPEGHNFYGPTLNGVVGRPAGTVPGYNYSEANEKSGIVWTADALKVYLREPQHNLPGTKMTFAGLKDPQEIDDVIAYLSEFGPDGKKKAAQ